MTQPPPSPIDTRVSNSLMPDFTNYLMRLIILKNLFSKALGTEQDISGVPNPHSVDDDKYHWLKSLIELFPIGKKQRYYPEYKTDIVFDTLIIAYCVNGHFLYSAAAIECDTKGRPEFFRIGQAGERIHVAKVKSFNRWRQIPQNLRKNSTMNGALRLVAVANLPEAIAFY
jgi:hypothetical protein